MRSRVILHGAFKGDNFGDTLLLKILAQRLNANGCSVLLSNVCDRTLKWVTGDARRLTSIKEIVSASALIYAGGGYFGEQPQGRVRWHLRLFRQHIPIGLFFATVNKPYGCLGPGVGPLTFPLSRLVLGALLARSVINVVRDEQSAAYLESFGCPEEKITVTADSALTLERNDFAHVDTTDLDVHLAGERFIIIHSSFSSDRKPVQQAFYSQLRQFAQQDSKVKILAITDRESEEQNEAAAEVVQIFGETRCRVEKYAGPDRLCAILSKSSGVVTNKLHVGIVATAFGIPAFSSANHPKTLRFYDQIGKREHCSLREALPPDSIVRFLTEALAGNISRPANLDELKTSAIRGLDYLPAILHRRRIS